MITRRRILAAAAVAGATAVYALGIEPGFRLTVKHHRIAPPGWPRGAGMRIVALADPHMGAPHMPLGRLERVVARASTLGGDLVVLLGDYEAGHRFVTEKVPLADTARVLARLEAPLGVFAILGNHDWWHDRDAQARRAGPPEAGRALEAAGVPVLENRAVRIAGGPVPFWLLGLGDQLAFGRNRPGADDLPGTLAQVEGGEPAILMAHEPDIFPEVPDRVVLTLSGHTHGGQVRLFGYSPLVPSRFGNRYAYGHVREGRRELVVSGGLGCSILPVRLGVPPEITVIDLE
ncbi:MAG TPA: metallophosphoesterase [Thermohalobaculum sp.]|nr:metallophosphoesterase [Thermohalobaculum sp.]